MKFTKENRLNNKSKSHFTATIFIIWMSLWLSIGSYPDNISGKGVYSLINGLRNINALIFSILLFFYIFALYINKFFEIKIFNIFVLFTFHFFFQFIGLYQNNLLDFNINILFLPIFSISTLILIFIIEFKKIINLEKYLLYFSIFFIFTLTLVILFSLKDRINFNNHYLNNLVSLDIYFLNNTLPRITGLSRSVAILNVCLIICLLFLVKKKINKATIIVLAILFSLAIWMFQSRGTIVCFVIVNIFILICSNKKLSKLFFILITFVIPIIAYETYIFNKVAQQEKTNLLDSNAKYQEEIRITKFNTSGRIELWKSIITNYNKNKIFGYGPQGDRFLISGSLNEQYGNNVSNALLYSFVSGGYFSLFIFLLIYLKLIIYLYKMVFMYKIFRIRNYISEKIAVSLILFFIVRSLFENSFAVFGVDYLFFVISLYIIYNFEKKNNRIF